jgi:membrane-associated phospholipid phosphatase
MNLKELKLYPFDLLIIGYCLLMSALILALGRPFPEYLDELAFYVGMAAMALMIVRFADESRGGRQRFIRLLYPALMFTFLYHETGGMMFLLFDRFYDFQLTAFERSVFGVDPSLFLDSKGLPVFYNELFSACYFSYYLMIPAFLAFAFLKRKDDTIRRFLTASCMAFIASYILFFLYPVEGPRYHFAGQYVNQIKGPFFRQMVNYVIDTGAVRGGCMPSSHVGVGLVVLAYVFKVNRKAGWWLVPVNIGLAIGTVWGRFHYVSDVVVGATIGLGSVWVVNRYYDRWMRRETPEVLQPNMSREHVS